MRPPEKLAAFFISLSITHAQLEVPPSHISQHIQHTFEYTHLLVSPYRTVTMSGQSIAKRPRPVVFSLGELRRYPTLEKRYAITLPFEDPPYCCFCRSWVEPRPCCKRWLEYCKVKAKCIKRTGERWAVSDPSEPHFFACDQPGPDGISCLSFAGRTERC